MTDNSSSDIGGTTCENCGGKGTIAERPSELPHAETELDRVMRICQVCAGSGLNPNHQMFATKPTIQRSTSTLPEPPTEREQDLMSKLRWEKDLSADLQRRLCIGENLLKGLQDRFDHLAAEVADICRQMTLDEKACLDRTAQMLKKALRLCGKGDLDHD